MKKVIAIGLVLAVLLLLAPAALVAAEDGEPTLPHAFYGTVKTRATEADANVNAQVETLVVAMVGGVEKGRILVTTAGKYGGPTLAEGKLVVSDVAASGSEIRFYINNSLADTPAGGWPGFNSGAIDELNLTGLAPAPGGGGGPPGPPPGRTMISDFIRPDGIFTSDVTAWSDDGKGKLIIGKSTKGLTKDGLPLSYIDFTTVPEGEEPAVGAGVSFAGNAYELGPPGATFDPAITVGFTLDASDVPVDTTQVISYFDPDTGAWVNLDTTVTFDPVTNTYTFTAEVSNFSYFAVLAYGIEAPPEAAVFKLGVLTISPAEVEIDKDVIVSISVSNTGGAEGTYKVTLKINGVKEAEKSVAVAAGGSEPVSFTTSRDAAGTYSVDVNGLTGSFTVRAAVPVPAPAPAPAPAPVPTPPAEINWPIIWGVVAGVAVLGLIIFFLARRRQY